MSYSHKGRKWLRKLEPHLQSLTDGADVVYWKDEDIESGDIWRDEIERALGSSLAAVLLVSADFLASRFIRYEELPRLLDQAEERRTRLYALIVRPCRCTRVQAPARFQAVNPPDQTLSELTVPKQERIFVRLVDQLERALDNPR